MDKAHRDRRARHSLPRERAVRRAPRSRLSRAVPAWCPRRGVSSPGKHVGEQSRPWGLGLTHLVSSSTDRARLLIPPRARGCAAQLPPLMATQVRGSVLGVHVRRLAAAQAAPLRLLPEPQGARVPRFAFSFSLSLVSVSASCCPFFLSLSFALALSRSLSRGKSGRDRLRLLTPLVACRCAARLLRRAAAPAIRVPPWPGVSMHPPPRCASRSSSRAASRRSTARSRSRPAGACRPAATRRARSSTSRRARRSTCRCGA